MEEKREKPTPEAKALSLFLMAYKSDNQSYKDKARQMKNRLDLVLGGKLDKDTYQNEVKSALASYGGYTDVIEKTVKFYIEKFGEYKSQGDDKYSQDAQAIAEKLMGEEQKLKGNTACHIECRAYNASIHLHKRPFILLPFKEF